MDHDQLAEYELRRLNFSDDNWRIGHNRESEGPARGMLFYELDADELDELTPWLREMPARTRSFSGYTSELMRPCGTTNCLDQLTPRSSRPQRAGEINTRLQIARLPAPSIFDAPKGGQS
jgi:hypothetical protein